MTSVKEIYEYINSFEEVLKRKEGIEQLYDQFR